MRRRPARGPAVRGRTAVVPRRRRVRAARPGGRRSGLVGLLSVRPLSRSDPRRHVRIRRPPSQPAARPAAPRRPRHGPGSAVDRRRRADPVDRPRAGLAVRGPGHPALRSHERSAPPLACARGRGADAGGRRLAPVVPPPPDRHRSEAGGSVRPCGARLRCGPDVRPRCRWHPDRGARRADAAAVGRLLHRSPLRPDPDLAGRPRPGAELDLRLLGRVRRAGGDDLHRTPVRSAGLRPSRPACRRTRPAADRGGARVGGQDLGAQDEAHQTT